MLISKNILNFFPYKIKFRSLYKLAEVGILEQIRQHGNYEIGQLFLHRTFGYRGLIIFPWQAKVFDRDSAAFKPQSYDITNLASAHSSVKKGELLPVSTTVSTVSHNVYQENPKNKSNTIHDECDGLAQNTYIDYVKTVKGYSQTYYQVLIDSRDWPFIGQQSESVTFLGGQQNSRASLYAVPGLDYVSHDDILPYTTTEEFPFYHELFNRFINYNPDKNPRFKPKETLKIWQEKNYSWLELTEVHKEITEGIRVTVLPFFMGRRESNNMSVYWWRYCIRLENLLAQKWAVQLLERHWRIFSFSGTLETVRGRGVVGQEPTLYKDLPAFQYSSHISLQCPSGHMWGTFRMERQDGYSFDCKIPPFALDSGKNYDN
ncbi:polymerase delta-interacting protein 2-like isoform X2 [Gordionus sp. m RMFG-2023]|uniref:polymerase delta-interacting protein 2-like isoform X2 n=1 Tax=Gordionus sp. m RMFG-2023 TaxID=3053472 RepID=UPI0031FC9074